MAVIDNSRSNSLLAGSSGNDVITNNASNVTINAGAGDDSIRNYANQVKINAGDGADSVSNLSSYVTVAGGDGNDYIYNNGHFASVEAGAGDDTIENYYNGNGGDYGTLNGGAGNDSISNRDGYNITVNGGEGNDTITSYNDHSLSLVGGEGDDLISLGGLNRYDTVVGGKGNDTINISTTNTGSILVQYEEGDGNDLIEGFNSNSTLKIMSGTVSNTAWEGTNLLLAVGNSTITLAGVPNIYSLNVIDKNGNKVTLPDENGLTFTELINGTSDGDPVTIDRDSVKAVLDGGSDRVYAYGVKYNWVDTGDDNDNIEYYGSNSTILAGNGNDTLYMTSNAYDKDNYVDLGAGNDYISNNGPRTTILAGAGNDTIYACSNTTEDVIDGGDGDDRFNFGGPRSTVFGGNGRDSIYSYAKEAVIYGGEGNDTITNSGATKVLIDGGEDNDYITSSYGTDSTLLGGTGNDTINLNNYSTDNMVDGGEGNDVIRLNSSSNSNTIKVGEGDDTIRILSTYVRNLTVEDFGAGDEIVLAQAVNGLETIDGGIRAGNVTISGLNGTIESSGWELAGNAASYVHIKQSNVVLKSDNRTIVYGNGKAIDRNTIVTVDGVISKEELTIDTQYKVVTVPLSSLSQDLTVTISDEKNEYNLAMGPDVPQPEVYEKAGWRQNGKIATYKDDATTEGYVLDDKQIYYQSKGEGDTIVQIKGVFSSEGLKEDLTNKVVTVFNASLYDENGEPNRSDVITISEGFTLALDEEAAKLTTDNFEGWKIDGTTATYVKESSTYGYKLDTEKNQIGYSVEGTNELIVTVNGLKSDITDDDKDGKIPGLDIDLENKIVTVHKEVLGEDDVVTISDGYTLALGDDVVGPTMKDPVWDYVGNNAFGRVEAEKAGYILEDNQISFVAEGTNNNLVVYNLNPEGEFDPETLVLKGDTVTVDYSALRGDFIATVRVNPGYKLAWSGFEGKEAIAEDEIWEYRDDGNIATYTSSGRNRGFSLVNNQIILLGQKDADTVNIMGVKTTVSEDSKSVEGIKLNNDTFTISNSALIGENVAIDAEGYKLALADDVTRPEVTILRGWKDDENTASFSTGALSAGYELTDDEMGITHKEAEEEQILFKVEGIKNSDGLYLDEKQKVVTVYNSALNGTDIKITTLVTDEDDPRDYALELGDNDKGAKDLTGWEIDRDKRIAGYREDASTEGYTVLLGGKSIIYAEAVEGEITVELSGIDRAPTFASSTDEAGTVYENDPETKTIQLGFENFAASSVAITKNIGEFKFSILQDDYSNKTFVGTEEKETISSAGNELSFDLGAGADKFTNSGANVEINGGAGNDKITNTGEGVTVTGGVGNDYVSLSADSLGGGNTYVYAAGKDNVSNFGNNDTLQIAGKGIDNAVVRGEDVEFKVGTGTVTLKKSAISRREIKIVGTDGKDIEGFSGNIYTPDGIIIPFEDDERKMILATTFTDTYVASRVQGDTVEVGIIDGSNLENGAAIDASTDGISLIGGVGKDTLISGETNGFSLTGGAGNDIFVYKGGKGTIADYSQKGTLGKDKIVSDIEFTSYAVSGKNVILSAGTKDSLTIENGVGKEITFGTTKTEVYVYKGEGIFDSAGKQVSISGFDATLGTIPENSFDATKNYSKLITINGALADHEMTIIGNKKANHIIAGNAGATLNGGKGKDTLEGGGNDDVFVFENKSGNKLIKNYGAGDQISLGSGAKIAEIKNSGNDLELRIGNNKITIEGGKGQEIRINDGTEKTFTKDGLLTSENGGSENYLTVSLTSSFRGTDSVDGTIDLSHSSYENLKYKDVSAELLKKAYAITGDNLDNSLLGGKGNDTIYGGEGNDIIRGGKGNDILWGNSPDDVDTGADVFEFWAGDGTDTIKDFQAGIDSLMIYDKHGREGSFSKAVFGNDKLTLSVRGGGKIILEGLAAGEFVTINRRDYQIVGKKLATSDN